MARESLADRIKQGPLLPRWKQLVAKNKDITGLKGDVDGPLADYDKSLKSAGDADGDMSKAWNAMLSAFTVATAAREKEFADHTKTLDQLKKDASDQIGKISTQGTKLAQTDIPAAMDAVSKLMDAGDNFTQLANALQKDLEDARQTWIDALEKAYGDARKAVDGAQDQKKKLEDGCNKLEDTARKTITDMEKQAIKNKNDKMVAVLEGFLKTL